MNKYNTAPIKAAVAVIGSKAALGRKLGLSRQHIYLWCNGTPVSIGKCKQIEALTARAVKASDLRPDVFWGE